MGDVYKREGSPFYWWRFRHGGKEHRGSTGFSAKAAAQRYLAERIAEISRGEVPDRKARLGPFADEFLGWLAGEGLKPRWIEHHRRWIADAVEYLGAERPLRLITPRDLEGYRERLRRTPSYRGGVLAPRTIHGYLSALRRMLDLAVRRGLLPRSPFRDISMPRLPTAAPKYLTPEEAASVLEAAPDAWWRSLLTVALFTGARRGELCRLRWPDVDWETARIRLRQQKTDSVLEIALHPAALAALKTLPRHIGGRVFHLAEIEARGADYDRRWEHRVTWKVRAIFKGAGLDGSLHTLRHTFATMLLRACGNLRVVQEALGHRKIETTTRYAFAMKSDVDRAVRSLQSVGAAGTKTGTVEVSPVSEN